MAGRSADERALAGEGGRAVASDAAVVTVLIERGDRGVRTTIDAHADLAAVPRSAIELEAPAMVEAEPHHASLANGIRRAGETRGHGRAEFGRLAIGMPHACGAVIDPRSGKGGIGLNRIAAIA